MAILCMKTPGNVRIEDSGSRDKMLYGMLTEREKEMTHGPSVYYCGTHILATVDFTDTENLGIFELTLYKNCSVHFDDYDKHIHRRTTR